MPRWAALMTDLEDAWNALHGATPAGWHVGRPSYHERRQWVQYAFDPSERPVVGLRSRQWTAVAECEEAVVRDIGAELGEGRAPR